MPPPSPADRAALAKGIDAAFKAGAAAPGPGAAKIIAEQIAAVVDVYVKKALSSAVVSIPSTAGAGAPSAGVLA